MVSIYPSPCLHVSGIPQTENGTNRKQEISFVFCNWKTGAAKFHLFAAIGNGKQTYVFLDQPTKNEK
jgi:hypothetical protein